jgi:hypothetical protein
LLAIIVGLDRFIVVPSPNCPELFNPQAYKDEPLIAIEWLSPADTTDHEFCEICIGTAESTTEELPSCPWSFFPHAHRLESEDLMANVWNWPDERVFQLL